MLPYVRRVEPTDKVAIGGTPLKKVVTFLPKHVPIVRDALAPAYECYSGDTEVLTAAGWKNFAALEQTDFVATVDPQTRRMFFVRPTRRVKYEYSGNMVYLYGKFVDLLVTPEHNLLLTDGDNARFLYASNYSVRKIRNRAVYRKHKTKFIQSVDAYEPCVIDMKFDDVLAELKKDLSGRGIIPYSQDKSAWAAFFGWYVAEGCIDQNYVVLSANYRSKVEISRVESVMRCVGLVPCIHLGKHLANVKACGKTLVEILEREFGRGAKNKCIPRWLLHSEREILDLFVGAVLDGDGYKEKGGWRSYNTASHRLADDLQEALFRLGIRAVKHKYLQHDKRTGKTYTSYRLYISRSIYSLCKSKYIPYTGYVYCATAEPYHTLVVRRNGRIVVCGNSDIPFTMRYMLDRVSLEDFGEPYKPMYLDIELGAPSNVGIEDVSQFPVLCMSTVFEGELKTFLLKGGDEHTLLMNFLTYFIDCNPDVICGWNIPFDIRVLIQRLGGAARYMSPLGYVNSGIGGPLARDPDIPGRIIFDLCAAYKILKEQAVDKPRNYSLNTVAEFEFGPGWEMPAWSRRILEIYSADPGAAMEYNVRHTKLCRMVDEKFRILETFSERQKTALCEFRDTMHASLMFDRLLLRRSPFALPSKPKIEDVAEKIAKKEVEGYTGAVVFDPVPGLHRDVALFDFRCVSADTEVLTPRGWRKISSVDKGDRVLSLDPTTFAIELDRVVERYKYPYRGQLFRLKTRHLDCLMTANHRVLSRRSGGRNRRSRDRGGWKEWEYVEARSLRTYIQVPVAGVFGGRKCPFSDDFVRVIGWVLTEGHIGDTGIVIYQKGRYVADIRAALVGSGISFHEGTRRDGEHEFLVHALDARWIRSLVPGKDMSLFLSYDVHTREILFETMMKGDGTNGGRVYTSCSEKLADQFQVLCVITGRRAVLSCFDDEFFVYVSDRMTTQVNAGPIKAMREEPVDYGKFAFNNGKYVHCIGTERGNFIARRNGKVFVTGNSLYPSIVLSLNISPETMCPVDVGDYRLQEIGVGFRAQPVGLMPSILRELLDRRAEARALSKEVGDAYDLKQRALKILANAAYGSFGFLRFRLYNRNVAQSITCVGRMVIQAVKQHLESLGFKVIYGDTDSIFVVGVDDPRGLIPSINVFVEKFMRETFGVQSCAVEIELDSVYRSLFFGLKKKRYMGMTDSGKMVVKGFEVKRRDCPKFGVDLQKEVMGAILEGKSESDILALAKDVYTKLVGGQIPLKDIGIPKRIGSLFAYKRGPDDKIKFAWAQALQRSNDVFGTNYVGSEEDLQFFPVEGIGLVGVVPEDFGKIDLMSLDFGHLVRVGIQSRVSPFLLGMSWVHALKELKAWIKAGGCAQRSLSEWA